MKLKRLTLADLPVIPKFLGVSVVLESEFSRLTASIYDRVALNGIALLFSLLLEFD